MLDLENSGVIEIVTLTNRGIVHRKICGIDIGIKLISSRTYRRLFVGEILSELI